MEEEIIKEEPIDLVKEINKGINTEVMADCFVALSLSVLRQFLLSSEHKYFIISDMLSNLEKKGYSEEEMNKIKMAMNTIVDNYRTSNSFVG